MWISFSEHVIVHVCLILFLVKETPRKELLRIFRLNRTNISKTYLAASIGSFTRLCIKVQWDCRAPPPKGSWRRSSLTDRFLPNVDLIPIPLQYVFSLYSIETIESLVFLNTNWILDSLTTLTGTITNAISEIFYPDYLEWFLSSITSLLQCIPLEKS